MTQSTLFSFFSTVKWGSFSVLASLGLKMSPRDSSGCLVVLTRYQVHFSGCCSGSSTHPGFSSHVPSTVMTLSTIGLPSTCVSNNYFWQSPCFSVICTLSFGLHCDSGCGVHFIHRSARSPGMSGAIENYILASTCMLFQRPGYYYFLKRF